MTRPIAVLDIDGVLADVAHRLPALRGPRKDWAAFFAGAVDDPPLLEGLAVADTLAAEHELVYCSGRPERLRAVTAAWLEAHGLPPGRLVLRPDGDRRPARVLKAAAVRRLQREAPVAVVVDDDAEVVAALTALGVPVLHATWATPDTDLKDAQEHAGRT
jgi:phosphoglycolate phosphatase-like HAD superfamily hydrolase